MLVLFIIGNYLLFSCVSCFLNKWSFLGGFGCLNLMIWIFKLCFLLGFFVVASYVCSFKCICIRLYYLCIVRFSWCYLLFSCFGCFIINIDTAKCSFWVIFQLGKLLNLYCCYSLVVVLRLSQFLLILFWAFYSFSS